MARKRLNKYQRERMRRDAEARQQAEAASRENRQARKEREARLRKEALDKSKRRGRVPVTGLANKAPTLFSDERYKAPLARVRHKAPVRSESEWKPRGKGPETLFRSFIRHRLVEYRTPVFLYNTAHLEARGPFDLFCHVARGGSLPKAVKAGDFPVPFTKRMCHEFLQHPAKTPFYEAVRRTQVQAEDGNIALANAVTATRLGDQFMGDEEFWATVIRWLCRHPEIEPHQVGPLIDFLQHRRDEDQGFSMKGRGVAATLRRMEEWHDELAKAQIVGPGAFKPSGFEPGIWEFKRKHPYLPREKISEVWTVEEVLTASDLRREGRQQRHCVAAYASAIRQGRSSIWTMRSTMEFRGDERHLTIEVMNSARAIVQARGNLNRMPTPKENQVLNRWASENNLTLRTRHW